jgi:hypothetical protein
MSILKSIMHHWNKTTKSYDTLHPETESAQITDWHSGIMASLASKTLGTVVDSITTDSVLGKLIKMLLDASGVKYLIDTSGYVCFGSLFGGLIIQWGIINLTLPQWTYNFPIAFSTKVLSCCTNDCGSGTYPIGFNAISKSQFTVYWNNTKNSENLVFFWLALGK